MTTSESKGRFFCKMNQFESICITNRIDSNRELECSSLNPLASYAFGGLPIKTLKRVKVAHMRLPSIGFQR